MGTHSTEAPLRKLMGPGPLDIPPRVYQALTSPVIGHMDPAYFKTLDRIADAAIFAGLTLWFAGNDDLLGTGLSLAALVLGQVVSYARARAESLGAEAAVGIAERAERLIVVLVAAGLVGAGLPDEVLVVAMGVLTLLSAVTVVQRMVVVRRQLVAVPPEHEAGQR